MEIIQQSNLKLFKLLLGGVVMTLCGIGILYLAIGYMYSVPSHSTFIARNNEIAMAGAIIGILFFGSATMLIAYEIINKTPLMTICNIGIVYHSGLTRHLMIDWDDIAGIYTINFSSKTFIAIKLKSTGLFLQKQNWITRKIIGLNLSMGQADITISVVSANEPQAKVLAIMNKYWNDWKQNNEHEKV